MAWGLFDPQKMARIYLGGTEYRVLMTVASFVSPDDNLARVGPTQIGRHLGIRSQAASVSLKQLVERRILFKEDMNVYRVTPWLYFRGDVNSWEEITPQFPEPVWDARVPA